MLSEWKSNWMKDTIFLDESWTSYRVVSTPLRLLRCLSSLSPAHFLLERPQTENTGTRVNIPAWISGSRLLIISYLGSPFKFLTLNMRLGHLSVELVVIGRVYRSSTSSSSYSQTWPRRSTCSAACTWVSPLNSTLGQARALPSLYNTMRSPSTIFNAVTLFFFFFCQPLHCFMLQ